MIVTDDFNNLLRDRFRNKVNAFISNRSQHVARGEAESFSEYKLACGEVMGAEKALRMLDEAFKELQKEDEEF